MGKLVDTVASTPDGNQLAVEFKFHRKKRSSLPSPQLAGGLVSDLFRLAHAHHAWSCPCYMVYVTDERMARYLSTERSRFSHLMDAPVGSQVEISLDSLRDVTPTFLALVEKHKVSSAYPKVLKATQDHQVQSIRVAAARSLLELGQAELLKTALGAENRTAVQSTARSLASAG